MISRRHLAIFIFAASIPVTVYAQVIEIDDRGTAQTYDQPTVFSAGRSAPIRSDSRNADPRLAPADLVARAAAAHGVDPGLLRAVAWQESRGRQDAVSFKGAVGIMQLMPATAAELRVDPTSVYDNIRGGAQYLRRQLDRFSGNVPLALAAYNAGPGAVLRYGGVPPYRETQNYVSTILNRWRPTKFVPTPSITIKAEQ